MATHRLSHTGNYMISLMSVLSPFKFFSLEKEKELQKKEAKEKMESKKDMGKEIQAIKEKWEKRERERRERERLEKERLEKERRQKIREKVKAQNQDKLSPEKKPEQQQQQHQQKVVKEAIRPPREIRRYPVDLHQRRVEAPHHRPHYREQPHPEPKPVADTSAGPDPVRLNVRKALKDSLSARLVCIVSLSPTHVTFVTPAFVLSRHYIEITFRV